MTDEIYNPPVADPLPAPPIDRKRGRGLAAIGLFLSMLVLPASFAKDWIVADINRFADEQEVHNSETYEFQEALRARGKRNMNLVIGCYGLCLIGYGFCGAAVGKNGNRERWFQVGLVCSAISWIVLMFPFGVFAGLVILIKLARIWRQFKPSTQKEVAHG